MLHSRKTSSKTNHIHKIALRIVYNGNISSFDEMLKKDTRLFYISNTFKSNARLQLAKNQANAEQHPEAELLLFENFSHSSSVLFSKSNMAYSKNKQKNKCVCIHEIMRLIIMKLKMKMKNRSHRYDINRSRSRHGQKYSK